MKIKNELLSILKQLKKLIMELLTISGHLVANKNMIAKIESDFVT